MKRVLAVLVVVGLAGSIALAAPRTWKSSDGRFSTEAELLNFKDGKAELKKSDGNVVEVPLLSLSVEDREYVKRQFPGIQEEQSRPGAEYREWKSRAGKFSTLAEFLGYAEGKVQLRKLDGSEITVERKVLSTDDQRWITEELRRLREEEAEAKKGGGTAGQDVSGELVEQTIDLKSLRLDPPGKGKARGKSAGATPGAPVEYVLGLTAPQTFYMQLGKGAAPRGEGNNAAQFSRVVQNEPNYAIPLPFRGVAKLGSRQYGFALDASGPQAGGYNKLYFDLNGNGDLTDDKPIAAAKVAPAVGGISQSQFPRVDITLEVDGKSIEYAFFMSAIFQPTYATASLYAAAIREGYIAQGTKRTKLLLVDHNSNGRFDDTVTLERGGTASEGDLLLINPNPRDKLSGDVTMGRDRNFVSKTVCIGGNFYRMEVPPTGEKLKLTPTKLALGNVTNPSPAYRAVLYCEDYGVVMAGGTSNQKIPLPEGTWKVANYTIDASAFTGGSRTAITATFGEPAAVTVASGETAKLPFGAPYHASVTASRSEGNKVYLSLSIVGAAGERCTSFYVNGARPPQPRFVIKDKEGKTVHQGQFEYG